MCISFTKAMGRFSAVVYGNFEILDERGRAAFLLYLMRNVDSFPLHYNVANANINK